jgi:hypothetical protein
MATVNYDKDGKPTSVYMSYEEYCGITSKKEISTDVCPVPEEKGETLKYNKAKGFYRRYMGSKRFFVMKGSKARKHTTSAFDNMTYGSKRKDLIEEGVLKLDNQESEYEFMKDYAFKSASEAASVIDGNSRSGVVWKRM